MGDFFKFIASTKLDTTVDRVGICTFWLTIATITLCFVAWKQLRGLNKVSNADFIRKFSAEFFNIETRFIILLLNYRALKLKVKDIDYGDDIPSEPFPYFEVDKKIATQLQIEKIGSKDKPAVQIKDAYSCFEIDDMLLGHFEDVGLFEKRGLVDIGDVYEYFDWYMQTVWNNSEISNYIEQERLMEKGGNDFYENFEYIVSKSTSFAKSKGKNEWKWWWRLKWFIGHRLFKI